MDKRIVEGSEEFEDLLNKSDSDHGLAYAYFYLLVEDDLEDSGKIDKVKQTISI